ncbi:MAG: PQQ-binding-like beta-propeller repeat protein [Pseudomonadota bacterium]|jgi:alcohol dehydrogenase (cytochrome c)|nr:PQQ-binding-like beta-propeller repeat protein [Pseudomonadota bacterium]|tara:strand:+ start:900 stop:2936 length:2037 start_codon:yes stop_codon:yes gene_type:complete
MSVHWISSLKRLLVTIPLAVGWIIAGTAWSADAPATSSYTEDQFERGEVLYQKECALCHGLELDDGAAPAIVGSTFRKTWSMLGANVAELYNRIATTMPPRQDNFLSEDQNLDILSYLLGRNNVLRGTEALRNDYDYLAAIPIARGDETLDISVSFIEGLYGMEPTGNGPGMNELLNAGNNSDDWLHHNKSYKGIRYSALNEINTSNVDKLVQVCAYQMNSRAPLQTGPIVYQGIMYVTDATHTAAINAATCQKIWAHDWMPKDRMVWGNNRGVAIKDGYVVRGTPDGYLFALDSTNGNLLWARQVADPWLGETFTMPPTVFEDMILIGPAGSENAISGWLGAFSLTDGDLIWKFMTVPDAAAGGGESWGNPEGIKLGGGAVWTPLSFDLELGEVYVAVTNPAPDLPAYLRPGDNLYTNCIVALDILTGELKWYKSIVPNDDHDWDLTQVTPVLKAGVDGVSRDMVATVGKDGVLRTLDKRTHQPLYETPITTILNADIPVTREGVVACPGVTGGVLWSSPAYHPGEKILLTSSIDYCSRFRAANNVRFIPGQLYMGGNARHEGDMSGWITAVEVESGEVRWKYQTEFPNVAAVTTTAGGLAISGTLAGDLLFFDVATGEVLNSIATGAQIGGGNISYAVDGKQHIAVGSGRGMLTIRPPQLGLPRQTSIIVYALPSN